MKSLFKWVMLVAITTVAEMRMVAATNLVISSEWLQGLIEEARTNQPALKVSEAQIRAATAQIASVRRWENPTATLGGMLGAKSRRRDDGDLVLGVEQRVPLFGKAEAERRVAKSEQQHFEIALEERFQEIRKNIGQTALRLAMFDEESVFAGEDVVWLHAMVDVVAQRFASGGGTSQSEVLRLRAELAKRQDQILTIANERKAAAAMLNRQIGRPVDSEWGPLLLPFKAPKVTYTDRLVDLAVKYEPKLKRLRHEIQTAGRRVELADKQRRPDVSVGLEGRAYTGRGDMREGTVFVKVTLPWINKTHYAQDVKREKARQEAAAQEVESVTLEVREEIRLLTLRIDNARREVEVYREQIIPNAELALKGALAGYQTNREMLRDVMEARRLLVEARTMVVRALGTQWEATTELVLCCGLGDFESLEMLDSIEPKAKAH